MADTPYTFDQLCETLNMEGAPHRVRHALTAHRIYPAGAVSGRYVYDATALATLEKHFADPKSRKGMRPSAPAAAQVQDASAMDPEQHLEFLKAENRRLGGGKTSRGLSPAELEVLRRLDAAKAAQDVKAESPAPSAKLARRLISDEHYARIHGLPQRSKTR